MHKVLMLVIVILALVSCTTMWVQPTSVPVATQTTQANMANPAAVFCEQQGNKAEIRTAADGSQSGVCIFPDGSECDEWAYFRGECGAAMQSSVTPLATVDVAPATTEIPTTLPIDPADYQGWWTYTHAVYNFSIQLPEDWVVEEVTAGNSFMNDHVLNLHPDYNASQENIRMTFRKVGEDVPLWPSGVGQGEFISQGTLEIAGQPAQRTLLVCPTGEITSIWYQQEEGKANISRSDLEFGFIFSDGEHCTPGLSLGGKVQRIGEMIIASLKVD
jgi:putative hemolysin